MTVVMKPIFLGRRRMTVVIGSAEQKREPLRERGEEE